MEAGYFLGESDAPGAVDAPVHVGDDEGADIFVLDCPFELVVPASAVSVEVGIVLEIALASLVADGAVKGVVGQQKFHDSSPGVAGVLGGGVDLHGGCHLRAAGGDGLGCLFDLDEAHPAVAGHFEAFVVAEAGNLDIVFLGGLEDGEVVIDLVGFVVDEDLNFLGREGGEGPEVSLQQG